jgi:hypothetical protein
MMMKMTACQHAARTAALVQQMTRSRKMAMKAQTMDAAAQPVVQMMMKLLAAQVPHQAQQPLLEQWLMAVLSR